MLPVKPDTQWLARSTCSVNVGCSHLYQLSTPSLGRESPVPRGVGWTHGRLTGEGDSEEVRLRVTNWTAFWLSLRLCVLIVEKKKKKRKEMVTVLEVDAWVRITRQGSPRGEAWPQALEARSGDARALLLLPLAPAASVLVILLPRWLPGLRVPPTSRSSVLTGPPARRTRAPRGSSV